ncbi:MAG TPA: phage protein Gp27 family protein [Candidatus Angelobacter sp.]|nr:phage protein Gp27 family protein [Candidatus Angelobacter sp.]
MAARKKPKTGERRLSRQPLKIDRLPIEVRDKIQLLRAEGKTWKEIEELSEKFVPWDSLPTPLLNMFPDLRLPHSSLARWYDLRVDQVLNEAAAEQIRARQIAAEFAGAGITNLSDAVIHAMSDQIFAQMQFSDEAHREKAQAGLGQLALLVSRLERTKLAKDKLDLEREKLDAQKKKLQELDPSEVYLRAAEDVLKKLRTRKEIRAVIDPIKEELITEFAHSAEAYSKQIEARTA